MPDQFSFRFRFTIPYSIEPLQRDLVANTLMLPSFPVAIVNRGSGI